MKPVAAVKSSCFKVMNIKKKKKKKGMQLKSESLNYPHVLSRG